MNKKNEIPKEIKKDELNQPKKVVISQSPQPKEAITKFMEFDEVKDNMIIRKNRTQYVMIMLLHIQLII